MAYPHTAIRHLALNFGHPVPKIHISHRAQSGHQLHPSALSRAGLRRLFHPRRWTEAGNWFTMAHDERISFGFAVGLGKLQRRTEVARGCLPIDPVRSNGSKFRVHKWAVRSGSHWPWQAESRGMDCAKGRRDEMLLPTFGDGRLPGKQSAEILKRNLAGDDESVRSRQWLPTRPA